MKTGEIQSHAKMVEFTFFVVSIGGFATSVRKTNVSPSRIPICKKYESRALSEKEDYLTFVKQHCVAGVQVKVGDRVLPVAAFRGSTRPVLVVGSKGHISRALRAAEPFRPQLRQRGVSLITLQTDSLDSSSQLDALKKEFGRSASSWKHPSHPLDDQ